MHQKVPAALLPKSILTTEETTLKGNNRLLLSILQSNIYCLIKIEGKRLQYGRFEPYYEIVSIKKGLLDYFISYPEKELANYNEIHTTMILRLDNIDTSFVLREFFKSTAVF